MVLVVLLALAGSVVSMDRAPAAPPLGANPSSLVEQLGSSQYAVRESATNRLIGLGTRSREAVVEALIDPDPEVRMRAEAILEQIEIDRILKPQPITLDFAEAPLSEILDSIKEQTGCEFQVVPPTPEMLSRTLTLQSEEPVSFWEAIDRVASEARLRSDPSFLNNPLRSVSPVVRFLNGRPARYLSYYDRSFRIQITEIKYQADQSLSLDEQGRFIPPSKRLTASLQIQAHPGVQFRQTEPLVLDVAQDDQGRSLAPEANPNRVNSMPASNMGITFQLLRPEPIGNALVELRGRIPVVVSARRIADPLILTLQPESVGQSIRNNETEITLESYDPESKVGPTIKLTVRNLQGDETRRYPYNNAIFTQLELVDEQGRIVQWRQQVRSNPQDRQAMQLTMFAQQFSRANVGKKEEVGAPTKLKYYELVKTSYEIPFAFRDLPLPR